MEKSLLSLPTVNLGNFRVDMSGCWERVGISTVCCYQSKRYQSRELNFFVVCGDISEHTVWIGREQSSMSRELNFLKVAQPKPSNLLQIFRIGGCGLIFHIEKFVLVLRPQRMSVR